MNKKNAIIFFVVLFGLFLIYAWRSERSAWQDRPLSAAEYGGLISLRDVLPPEQYKKEVLPFLQKAADGVEMTQRELGELNARLGDVSKQALEAAKKLRPQEELVQAWESAKQGASGLSGKLERGMGKAKEELSRLFDDDTRSDAPQEAPRAAPGNNSDVPSQI